MGDDGDGRPSRRASASELTGELPAFVRDALDEQPPSRLDGEDAETIEALTDLGVPDEQARDAVVQGRVPLVLTQQLLGERPRYDLDTLASKAGVPADVLVQVRVAMGLPVVDGYGRTDLQWAKLIGRLLSILPPESVVRSARGRGNAVASIAMNDLSTIRDELVLPMRRAGADDLTVAVALAETARELAPIAEKLMVTDYLLHLQRVIGSEVAAIAARGDAQEIELAVGFVDVVGYTALSARIDPEGLDQILDLFEQRVIRVVADGDGVSVVKYLGDAAMFVAPDPVTLARTMLELTNEADGLEDAPLRGGMSFGATLVREGDYVGPTVNMAARLTDIARPWSLLAAEEIVDDLAGAFSVKRILPTRIRGVGLRRPLVVREHDEES